MATGVEPVGTALAVAGLLAAFKGALDGYLMIESYLESDDGNSYLTLRYHIEKHKLNIWGDFFKTSTPASCTLAVQPDVVKKLVLCILGEVKKTHQEAEMFVKKHELVLPNVPAGDVDKNLEADSQVVRGIAKLALGRVAKSRFGWVIKNKEKFAALVERLQQLNRDLYEVLQPGDVALLQKMLSSYVLAQIKGTGYVKKLQEPRTESPRLLALSGRLMTLQQSPAGGGNKGVVPIYKSDLTLQSSTWTTGIYKARTGQTYPVWAEWNILDPAIPSYKIMRERTESLAVMLQTVDDPALRIPPCCGVYDDLDFEAAYGIKRLGTIFTVPKNSQYEENLRKFEPVTLKQLLRSSRGDPPLLGHRFKLAFELASAFSLFHAAGWLHKGFRSENIMFFHHKGDKGPTITEPLVTGFQASRTLDATSLPRQAARDPETEYYYHPEAENGFSKKLDLYGLGVVLCEIGRWELLVDAIPAKKDRLKDRAWSTKFLVGSTLKDLGWRMGDLFRQAVQVLLTQDLPDDDDDFFAHEFFQKVILPLDTCTA